MSRKNKGIDSTTWGCPPGHGRRTIIIPTQLHEAMKKIAWFDRKKIYDVYTEAIYEYIDKQKDRAEEICRAYKEAEE